MQHRPALLKKTQRRAIHARIPLSATLELTERCNLRCRHCYIVESSRQRELQLSEWKNVLDQLAAEGALLLTLTGGEPLLRNDFFAIAKHARKREFAFVLFSNGTLITHETAARLRELQPQRVELSLLGGTASTHDRLSGVPGSFKRTLRGAEHLIAHQIPVQFKATWMRPNIGEAGQITKIANTIGASLRTGFLLLDHRCRKGSSATLLPTDRQLTRIANHELRPAGSSDEKPLVLTEEQQKNLHPCGAGQASCCIDAHGNLTPCVALRIPLGNLLTTPLRNLWKDSPELARIRAIRVHDLATCRACPLYLRCSRCAGIALAETGDILAPSPQACRLANLFHKTPDGGLRTPCP